MPTYEYECLSCGNRFEVFQRMTEAPLQECQECGGLLKRLIFPVGILFKGSGFHINDYSSTGPKSSTSSNKSDTESKNSSSS